MYKEEKPEWLFIIYLYIYFFNLKRNTNPDKMMYIFCYIILFFIVITSSFLSKANIDILTFHFIYIKNAPSPRPTCKLTSHLTWSVPHWSDLIWPCNPMIHAILLTIIIKSKKKSIQNSSNCKNELIHKWKTWRIQLTKMDYMQNLYIASGKLANIVG